MSNGVWADQNDIVWKAFEQRGIASPSEKGMTNEEKKPTIVMALSLMCILQYLHVCGLDVRCAEGEGVSGDMSLGHDLC